MVEDTPSLPILRLGFCYQVVAVLLVKIQETTTMSVLYIVTNFLKSFANSIHPNVYKIFRKSI